MTDISAFTRARSSKSLACDVAGDARAAWAGRACIRLRLMQALLTESQSLNFRRRIAEPAAKSVTRLSRAYDSQSNGSSFRDVRADSSARRLRSRPPGPF